MADSILTSSRLTYHAIEDSDDDFLFELQTDPQSQLNLTNTLTTPQAKSDVKEQRTFFTTCILSAVIWTKPTTESEKPERIGVVMLRSPGKPGTRSSGIGELGIDISRKYHRHGYGGEAVEWLMEWSFRWANIRKVSLKVFDYNVGAVKLYEKLGFVFEGRLREEIWYDGEWRDTLAYSMLKREWEEKYGSGKTAVKRA